ncbi:MAG: hypothetical protein EBR82_44920, partial [Caulobacteraceae bacterium]|nr:hypothetical protein [Caulobacteraceae bacterium]
MKKTGKPKLVTYRITLDYSTTDDQTHPSKWMDLDVLLCGEGGEAVSWVKSEEIPTPEEHRETLACEASTGARP